MLKSCSQCGGIHAKGVDCPNKKNIDYVKKDEIYIFRNTIQWQKKREEIKERDLHLCRACLCGLQGTRHTYNSKDLQVHHIQGVRTNWEQRLDNDNLITLCKYHHAQADSGIIRAKKLKELLNTAD